MKNSGKPAGTAYQRLAGSRPVTEQVRTGTGPGPGPGTSVGFVLLSPSVRSWISIREVSTAPPSRWVWSTVAACGGLTITLKKKSKKLSDVLEHTETQNVAGVW